jgi:extracellular factor (EF) 3-hydroxypalmitic acid methyl ester biosynthesis protein
VSNGVIGTESFVTFNNASGFDGRGTLLHLTRQQAVFEVYNPHSIVQLSEVLADVRVCRGSRMIYSGRAVVSGLVPTGSMLIVSTALIDPWHDLTGLESQRDLHSETQRFIQDWERGHQLDPEFQLIVTSAANFLQELSRWLNEAEATVESADHENVSTDLYEAAKDPAMSRLGEFIERFERAATGIEPASSMVHRAFTQRELHPLLLTAPFVHRSFVKPLGYAGDYEMVNMILRNAGEGPNAYSRILNTAHLSVGPAAAHRNRIELLTERLRREAMNARACGERLRVLNVGCGPAAELQALLAESDLLDGCDLTLMDFNEPTLEHTRAKLTRLVANHGRTTELHFLHKSIHQLLREAIRGSDPGAPVYDLVYCAGLYDYLTDTVCRRITRLFYEKTKPGGLVMLTNVHPSNPVRFYMEYLVEWHLEYRSEDDMLGLAKGLGERSTLTDKTGVNVFLEIRKPLGAGKV